MIETIIGKLVGSIPTGCTLTKAKEEKILIKYVDPPYTLQNYIIQYPDYHIYNIHIDMNRYVWVESHMIPFQDMFGDQGKASHNGRSNNRCKSDNCKGIRVGGIEAMGRQ